MSLWTVGRNQNAQRNRHSENIQMCIGLSQLAGSNPGPSCSEAAVLTTTPHHNFCFISRILLFWASRCWYLFVISCMHQHSSLCISSSVEWLPVLHLSSPWFYVTGDWQTFCALRRYRSARRMCDLTLSFFFSPGVPFPWCADVWRSLQARNMLLK